MRRLRCQASGVADRVEGTAAFAIATAYQVEQLGVDDDRREQLGAGLEQHGVVIVETARLPTLDDQHPNRPSLHHQRCCNERFEPLFTRLGEVLVRGISARVFDRDRLATLSRQTHQALPESQSHAAHGTRDQTDRRAQRQMGEVGVSQVDAANIRIQPLGDQICDIRERFPEVVRPGDDLRDVGQN